jgi:hypothetical protein
MKSYLVNIGKGFLAVNAMCLCIYLVFLMISQWGDLIIIAINKLYIEDPYIWTRDWFGILGLIVIFLFIFYRIGKSIEY